MILPESEIIDGYFLKSKPQLRIELSKILIALRNFEYTKNPGPVAGEEHCTRSSPTSLKLEKEYGLSRKVFEQYPGYFGCIFLRSFAIILYENAFAVKVKTSNQKELPRFLEDCFDTATSSIFRTRPYRLFDYRLHSIDRVPADKVPADCVPITNLSVDKSPVGDTIDVLVRPEIQQITLVLLQDSIDG